MDMFVKVLKFILNTLINVIFLTGFAIFLAWAIWDVSPQTSITNTAYFFSESWHIVTGTPRRGGSTPSVTREQLVPAEKRIKHIDK